MLTTRLDRGGQGGFAIFSALFVLLLMALLSAAIATLSANSQMASASDITGVQARQAARAGSEWGMHKAWNADPAFCTASGNYNNFSAPLFGGMSVTVLCATAPVDELPARVSYSVTAWACNQPDPLTQRCPGNASQVASPTYVERKIFAIIER